MLAHSTVPSSPNTETEALQITNEAGELVHTSSELVGLFPVEFLPPSHLPFDTVPLLSSTAVHWNIDSLDSKCFPQGGIHHRELGS